MFEKNREILETITLHVDNIVIQLQSSDIFWVYILCEDNSHGAHQGHDGTETGSNLSIMFYRKIEYKNNAMTCCLFPENNDSIESVKYEVEQNTFEAEIFDD